MLCSVWHLLPCSCYQSDHARNLSFQGHLPHGSCESNFLILPSPFPYVYTTPTCTPCSYLSGTLHYPSLTACWLCIWVLSGPVQHSLLVASRPLHHLTPLLTAIQVCSLSGRTGLPAGLSVPVVASPVPHSPLPLLWISFPASYWLPDSNPSHTPCLHLHPFPSAIHFILKMAAARLSEMFTVLFGRMLYSSV